MTRAALANRSSRERHFGVADVLEEARNPRPKVLRPRRLVGRDREIHEVIESVGVASVTTLTGPGGVGKTAMATTVAAACSDDFSDGVAVVWLGSLRSAELVAARWPHSSGCRGPVANLTRTHSASG